MTAFSYTGLISSCSSLICQTAFYIFFVSSWWILLSLVLGNLQWNDFSSFHCCSLCGVFKPCRRMTFYLTSCLSIIRVSGLAVTPWFGHFVSYDTNRNTNVCLVALALSSFWCTVQPWESTEKHTWEYTSPVHLWPLSLVSCKDSRSAFPLSYMILYHYHYQVCHETHGKLPFWLAPWAFPMSFLIMHLSVLSIGSPRALSLVWVFWNRTGTRMDVIRTLRVTGSIRNTSNKGTCVIYYRESLLEFLRM